MRQIRLSVVALGLSAVALAVSVPCRSDSLLVTGEPFLLNDADIFSIYDSAGTEDRNRAAVTVDGVARNLVVLPNLQPLAGSEIRACLRVNGVDTALCVSYASADWPNPKGNTATTVTVVQGALVTLHFTEQGTGSNANARASFALGPVASESVGAVVITSEPFLFDNANVFSIAPGSSGTEDRNRAGMPGPGTIRNLFVMPNQQPAVGSDIHACIRVNAVDTALCVVYGSADWPNPKGNTAASVAVAADDIVTVRFTEQAGISSTANVRASFEVR